MGYRNIKIDRNVQWHIKNQQLMLGESDACSFPLEDIDTILIENNSVKLSAYMLQKFASLGIAVYICDEKHMPNAVVLPMVRHSRHFRILKAQINLGKPLQKRLWQQIVWKKIENQAECLKLSGKADSDKLSAMAEEVQSGDKTHVESKAAAFYFNRLFGPGFSRGEDHIINSALNYGYAIVRGMIARDLICYGFEPSIGLFHKSELNSFNLADDLIETFRPIVDLYVASKFSYEDKNAPLTSETKRDIYRLITFDMLISKEHHTISNCVEKMVASLSTSMQEEKNVLKLPTLIALQEHRYE